MRKSIIVEGPNGSGKSTLGKLLAKEFGLVYRHAGPSPGDNAAAMEACVDQTVDLVAGCVMDRVTPISRVVYELPIAKDHAANLGRWIETMLPLATIVYCVGKGEFTDKEYYPNGHFDEVTAQKEDICRKYENLMHHVPHIRYNWDTDTYCELLEKIRNA